MREEITEAEINAFNNSINFGLEIDYKIYEVLTPLLEDELIDQSGRLVSRQLGLFILQE